MNRRNFFFLNKNRVFEKILKSCDIVFVLRNEVHFNYFIVRYDLLLAGHDRLG